MARVKPAGADTPLPAYTGKKQPPPEKWGTDDLYPYLPSDDLAEAVNLTIFLEKRPLLLKGEPGGGKTRLAHAVAHELGLPLKQLHIKSTSRARDGFYTYDAVRRLQEAQLAARGIGDPAQPADLNNYLKKGPLWRAFTNDRRTVVLIDEIDKADIDFPNDLLLELDQQRFVIEETGEPIPAKHPPIIFITSNDERDLSDAFLRRCLFHHIPFPGPTELAKIVKAHYPTADGDLVREAVKRFKQLRDRMVDDKGKAGKRVSTSELIDWFRVLLRDETAELRELQRGNLRYPAVLLKRWEDHLQYLTTAGTPK
jgi:MoxR-like ATPase